LLIITHNPGPSPNSSALNSHKEISLFGEEEKNSNTFSCTVNER